MSSIPSNLTGAILQTTQVQQQAAGIQKADSDARDSAFRSEARIVDERGGTVFANDEDTRVNPDGGGTGGQGRAFRGGAEETGAHQDQPTEDKGITIDETGQMHVDLEA